MFTQFVLWLKTFVAKDEEGQTLVEYALIIALIAILLIGALGFVRGGVNNVFGSIADALTNRTN